MYNNWSLSRKITFIVLIIITSFSVSYYIDDQDLYKAMKDNPYKNEQLDMFELLMYDFWDHNKDPIKQTIRLNPNQYPQSWKAMLPQVMCKLEHDRETPFKKISKKKLQDYTKDCKYVHNSEKIDISDAKKFLTYIINWLAIKPSMLDEDRIMTEHKKEFEDFVFMFSRGQLDVYHHWEGLSVVMIPVDRWNSFIRIAVPGYIESLEQKMPDSYKYMVIFIDFNNRKEPVIRKVGYIY